MREKECLLSDVISKFKRERTSLKSRIIKLETRLNKYTYDDSLDVKPATVAKSTMPAFKGAKSVHQDHVNDL